MLLPSGTSISSIGTAASVAIGGVNTSFPAIVGLSQNAGHFTVQTGGSFTTVAGISNSGTLAVGSGGFVHVNGDLTGGGAVSVGGASGSGAASFQVNSFIQSSITVNATGTLAVAHSNSPVINSTNTLTILPGGRLDLANSTLMIHYTPGADPLPTILTYLASGFDNGKWDGSGIISSTAAANPLQTTAIAYADSADGLVAGIPANTIELKYTLLGDTGLAGTVGPNDFTRLTLHYHQPTGGTWDTGDFNYDGSVNFNDFTLLTRTYNTSLGSTADPAVSPSVIGSGVASSVPEPGTALLGVVSVLFLSRRKRWPARL